MGRAPRQQRAATAPSTTGTALVGDLTLDCDTWSSPDGSGQRLMVLTAEPGTPSHDALRILTSWAAAPSAGGLDRAAGGDRRPRSARRLLPHRRLRAYPADRAARSPYRAARSTGRCGARVPGQAGGMLWLNRKTFAGS